MHIINAKREGLNHKYRNPWFRTKSFSDKLNAYFLDIRCADCEVDIFLAEALSKLFDSSCKTVVVYLEGYHRCDKNVRKFIKQYLNAFDFPNKIFAIASQLTKLIDFDKINHVN